MRRWRTPTDYDKTSISAVYDSGRGYRPEVLQRWLAVLTDHVPKDEIARIVDLGCGTGRFTEPLSVHFEAEVVGIDPSEKMLAQARGKTASGAVHFEQASGERLPLDDGSTDMVFMSMVFHHLPEPETTFRECRRILRDGGYLCLRNSTLDVVPTFPYMPFFEGIQAVVEAQLVTRAELQGVAEKAGLRPVAHQEVTHLMAPDWRSFAEKIALRADSFVARLADDDFERGIAEMRAHAETQDPAEPVTEELDFFVFRR